MAFQIKQDADLTKVQLFSDHTNSRREWNQAMMGSDPMAVVAKSIERPHELTLAELQIMDMYLVAAINEVRRLELLKDAGLNVDATVESLQVFYFGSNFAKAWYREYGRKEFGRTNEKISAVESDWVVSFFDRVMARLDENSGQTLTRDRAKQEEKLR